MSKSILVIGAFGDLTHSLSGQTIKTRNVYELIKHRSESNVYKADTSSIKRRPHLALSMLYRLIQVKTVVLIPCLNNLTYLFPFVYYLSKVFRYEIIQICIGGWQVEYFGGNERFKAHPLQLKLSKKIKAFLPEMIKVDNDLKGLYCFKNSEVFPNFRHFEAFESKNDGETLKLVFMARINKKKGYETIFNLAQVIIANHYNISISFYGQIEEPDRSHFLAEVEKYKDVATYKGVLQPNDIYKTLSQYDIMLFPTTYYTEGFPGTILDAYISGIPVIATNWKHAREFIKDGVTGYIVPFEDGQEEFNNRVFELFNDRRLLADLKNKAKKESERYSEESAWKVISKYL